MNIIEYCDKVIKCIAHFFSTIDFCNEKIIYSSDSTKFELGIVEDYLIGLSHSSEHLYRKDLGLGFCVGTGTLGGGDFFQVGLENSMYKK